MLFIISKKQENYFLSISFKDKRISSSQDIAITASADSSIRVWHIPSAQCLKVLKAHDSAITGLSLHPTGDYVLSSASDTYWALSDLRTGKLITKTQDTTSQRGKSIVFYSFSYKEYLCRINLCTISS